MKNNIPFNPEDLKAEHVMQNIDRGAATQLALYLLRNPDCVKMPYQVSVMMLALSTINMNAVDVLGLFPKDQNKPL